ncbi:oligosaccharide MFS transporter [Terrilactibacillus sp. BCM23-1]|uniref:Oligosaccharide MFS transporter n=1 Tax=Terrilactibacillus tamarindi TaxID=2599694 RepID=A0A6N8CQ70_9BACI|nr:oligosaccharide MFS transporter [Terrilactibacillus tamarindi]MTT32181.1 oligosaccharide MFS transporter [Terrilactibacillus tamarindi]
MNIFKSKKYWFSSSYLFFFFISWSVWWSFYSIWLNGTLDLTGAQTGTVFSINSTLALCFMLIYGIIQDKLGTKKYLIWFQSIILMGTGPFLIYVYEPLLQTHFLTGAILGGFYFGAGFLAGVALIETYVEKLSRKFNFEYGTSRMWGSIGYACATFMAGILLSINPHFNFWIASAAGVIYFLINCFYKIEIDDQEEKNTSDLKMKDILSTFKLKKFWYFTIFLFGTACIYTVYDIQLFPIYFTQHFSNVDTGYQVYGYLNSFQVFLESAMLFAAPFIVNKLGAKRALILAGVLMGTRIIGSALVADTISISLIKLLHGIELPILLIAIFKYISINFDPRLSATIYLIAFKISGELGVIFFSSSVGKMKDISGFEFTFFVLGALVFAFTILSIFFLSNQKKKGDNQYDNTESQFNT